MQPAGASRTNFDAAPGSAQFQVRTLEAVSVVSFRRVDCGLRRIAALAGIERIPDCTLAAPCNVKSPVILTLTG
eukprot:10918131-Alexandrium_andersonii.AAC.1